MSIQEQLLNIETEAVAKINAALTQVELNDLRAFYMGKKSPLGEIMKSMATLSIEDKKIIGKLANEVKVKIESAVTARRAYLEAEEVNKRLKSETIDVTLPGKEFKVGTSHPLSKTIEEVEEIFMGMGYSIAEGPEVEVDLYNFEMLNVPKGHPARDMQDSFYITENLLMRTQTSPVQVRTLLEKKGAPVKILAPGKVYRRDDDDATHSHQFMQIEGLLIDKNISLSDLKGTFDVIAKKLFGEDCVTRFRPSYYQFTEPSVETDISCFACKGKGCPLCKNTGWITISGAGMVHPNVLRNGGYDPKVWSGFAFGFGAERCAMLKYGITDIRKFYQTDLRESETFDRKED